MNKELIEQNQVKTIDSREVSEMLGVEHWQLLRKLDGSASAKMVGIIPTLNDNGIVVVDYFIKSTYRDVKGEERKCYLFTKMGCEFIANKFTGEKGILFTAKYVERFNKMEEVIKENEFTKRLPSNFKEALYQLIEAEEEKEKLNGKITLLTEENNALSKDLVKWVDENIINAIIRKHGASMGDFSASWIEFKRNLLYTYSININSRISNFMDKTGKKTKPKTLSVLRDKEELTKALKTAISMCNNDNIDISDILGKHLNNNEIKQICN